MVAHWLCSKASGIHFYRTHAYFLDDALTRLRSRKKKSSDVFVKLSDQLGGKALYVHQVKYVHAIIKRL